MMLSFPQPLQTIKISLQRSCNFEPQFSWYQQRTLLSSQPYPGQGQYKKSILNLNKDYNYNRPSTDKMGCAIQSCIEKQNEIQKRLKIQQTFSKNVMEIVLDTLLTIGMKFPSFNPEDHTKLTQFDFNYKSLLELKSQFIVNLALFQVSKRTLEDEQTFVFPPNFSKKKTVRIVSRYKDFFTKEDAEVAEMCQNLLNIVDCKYDKKVQDMQTKKYLQEEQKSNKVKLLNEGIKAALAMEKIELQNQGYQGTHSTTSKLKTTLQ